MKRLICILGMASAFTAQGAWWTASETNVAKLARKMTRSELSTNTVSLVASNGIKFTVVGDTNFISLTDQVALTHTNWANNTASGPSNIANLVLLSKVHPTNEVGAAALDLVGSVFTTGATGTNTFRPTGRITMVPTVGSATFQTWVFQSYTNSTLVNGEWVPQGPATTNFTVTMMTQGGQAFFGAGVSINGLVFTRSGADMLLSAGKMLLPDSLGVGSLVPTARLHVSGGTNEFLGKLSTTAATNAFVFSTNYLLIASNVVHVPVAADFVNAGGIIYWNSNGSHWISRCLDGSTVEHKSQWE